MFKYVFFISLFLSINSLLNASTPTLLSLKELCTDYLAKNYSQLTPNPIKHEEFLPLIPPSTLEKIFEKITDPCKLQLLDKCLNGKALPENKIYQNGQKIFWKIFENYVFCLENRQNLRELNSRILTNLIFKNTNFVQLSHIFEKLEFPLKKLTYLQVEDAHLPSPQASYETRSIKIASTAFPNLLHLKLVSAEENILSPPPLKFEFTVLEKLRSFTCKNIVLGESYKDLTHLTPELIYLNLKKVRHIQNFSYIKHKCISQPQQNKIFFKAISELLPHIPSKMQIHLEGYFFDYPFFEHLKSLNIASLTLKGFTYADLNYNTIVSLNRLASLKLFILDAFTENPAFPNNDLLEHPKQSLSLQTIGKDLKYLQIETPVQFMEDFSSLNHVVTLNLQKQVFTYRQLIKIFSLPNLQELALENFILKNDPEIRFEFKEAIPSLLKHLSLCFCNHQEILPFITKAFTFSSLKKLNLSFPTHTCPSPEFSEYLEILLRFSLSLESLVLIDIQLTSEDIKFLSAYKSLRDLKIKETSKSVSYTANDLEPLKSLEDLENLWVTVKSLKVPELTDIKKTEDIDLTEFLFLLQLKNIKHILIGNPLESIIKNKAFNKFAKTVFKK